MNLSTKYLGLELKNPLVVSSSNLTKDFESIRFCSEMGAGAVVTKSIFEGQLVPGGDKKSSEAKSGSKYLDLNKLLDLISDVKAKLDIPVIASVNCITDNEWTNYASKLEEAGADALELNISLVPFDKYSVCTEINNRYFDILESVKKNVNIPVSVKLGSYFTNIIGMASQLDKRGADGLVLFNRFYRPDINIETEEIIKTNILSGPSESTRSLRWVALLSKQLECDLSASTGIHDYSGVIKQLLVGAATTQVCSTLIQHGISYLETILFDLERWMERKGYNQLSDFQGKMHDKYEDNIAKFQIMQFMNKKS